MTLPCYSRREAKQHQTHENTTKREGGDDLLTPKIASNLLQVLVNLHVGRYKIGVKGCWLDIEGEEGNDTTFRGAHWESRMNLGGGAKG